MGLLTQFGTVHETVLRQPLRILKLFERKILVMMEPDGLILYFRIPCSPPFEESWQSGQEH